MPPPYAKMPARVKPSELTMINPVWIDIQENPKEFVAHKTVTFLWVLRGDGKVILGVEEPWKYPEAFDKSVAPVLAKMKEYYEKEKAYYEKKGVRDGMGGHPTLAAWFGADGKASGHAGSAFLGGELKIDGGKWTLTNESGRFGTGGKGSGAGDKCTDKELQDMLDHVKGVLKKQVKLDVVTKLVDMSH